MGVTQKSYDYDAIINLLNTGGEVDSALTDIQTILKDLEALYDRMQELFHGKGQKDIWRVYYQLYATLGYKNGQGKGAYAWGSIANFQDINNRMYSRAMYDKQLDEESDAMAAIGY